jgi:hypothetical protein
MQNLQKWIQQNRQLLRASGNCAVCGRDVRNRGVVDPTGAAGKGKGVVLCPQHAMEAGLGSKRTIAQFSPATLKTMKDPEEEQKDPKRNPKTPNLWEAFQGGWDADELSYDQWKNQYWAKGRRPRRTNWVQKWLMPPSVRRTLYRR